MNSLTNLGEVDLEELIAQLEKDLEMSGNAYQFSSKDANELVKELSEELASIDTKRGLDSLFYRIDINPSRFSFAMNDYLQLSLKIWDRTFKKVWTRKNYKP